MGIAVNSIDPIKVTEKLELSDCDLCKEALKCIKAYQRVVEMNQETNRRVINKLKDQSKKLKEYEQITGINSK